MSYLGQFDKQLFEYSWHLYENGYTAKDKPWKDYKLLKSTWQFPDTLHSYYARMWVNQRHLIEGKKILDIGCEIGSKISWFHSLKPASYYGLDPDPTRSAIAKSISEIVYGQSCVDCLSSNEIYKHTESTFYDTVYVMSVTQYMDKPWSTLMHLQCRNLVIDISTDKHNLATSLEVLSEKYNIIQVTRLLESRVGVVLTSK